MAKFFSFETKRAFNETDQCCIDLETFKLRVVNPRKLKYINCDLQIKERFFKPKSVEIYFLKFLSSLRKSTIKIIFVSLDINSCSSLFS